MTILHIILINVVVFFVYGFFLKFSPSFSSTNEALKTFFKKRFGLVKSKPASMDEKFSDLVNWRRDDEIQFTENGRLQTLNLASYTHEGAYLFNKSHVSDIQRFKRFEPATEDDLIAKSVRFIPLDCVLRNKSLEKRQLEDSFRESVTDGSYFRRMESIQIELDKINQEYRDNRYESRKKMYA